MPHAWRPMRPDDLPQVMAIAAIVHDGYFEAEAVFAERLALFADGCWIAELVVEGQSAATVGYMVMHPARHGHPPALNTLLRGMASDADCLHLHDIALLPATRGSGLGRAAVEILREVLRRHALRRATLVAVHDSSTYWRRHGFVESRHAAVVDIGTYGRAAVLMEMPG